MNLSINSFDDYKRVYAYSVAEPENFWAEVAETFYWQKNGTVFWIGTSQSPMLNGFLVQN